MGTLKIAVADRSADFRTLLSQHICSKNGLELVGSADTVEKLTKLIPIEKPHVLIMDLTIENSMTLLSCVQPKEPPLKILAVFRTSDGVFLPTVPEPRSGVYDETDTQIRHLADCISTSFQQELPPDSMNDPELEARVSRLLRRMGVPTHVKGYGYLQKAILMVMQDPSIMSRAVTKVLYPDIAKRYGTTAGRVERTMRHAIETAWGRSSAEVKQYYFGHTPNPRKRRPTNSEFIATLVEILRLQQDQIQCTGRS